MPTKKSPRRRTKTSKATKGCSRKGRPGCERKKKTCSYKSYRAPKHQPRKKKSRTPARKRTSQKATHGEFMDWQELELARKKTKCAASDNCDDDEDCEMDKKGKCGVKKEEGPPKFLDGTKYLTFRSNKKPSFTFRIPINKDTLIGQYAGAIRFSPLTGKLHLCYGPIIRSDKARSSRPLLSMLVKESVNKDLWRWYLNFGHEMQKKRIEEADDGNLVYTEIYGLPGASMQLTYVEFMQLQEFLNENGKEVSFLALPPSGCPDFLGQELEDECFPDEEDKPRFAAREGTCLNKQADSMSEGNQQAEFEVPSTTKRQTYTAKSKKLPKSIGDMTFKLPPTAAGTCLY